MTLVIGTPVVPGCSVGFSSVGSASSIVHVKVVVWVGPLAVLLASSVTVTAALRVVGGPVIVHSLSETLLSFSPVGSSLDVSVARLVPLTGRVVIGSPTVLA